MSLSTMTMCACTENRPAVIMKHFMIFSEENKAKKTSSFPSNRKMFVLIREYQQNYFQTGTFLHYYEKMYTSLVPRHTIAPLYSLLHTGAGVTRVRPMITPCHFLIGRIIGTTDSIDGELHSDPWPDPIWRFSYSYTTRAP